MPIPDRFRPLYEAPCAWAVPDPCGHTAPKPIPPRYQFQSRHKTKQFCPRSRWSAGMVTGNSIRCTKRATRLPQGLGTSAMGLAQNVGAETVWSLPGVSPDRRETDEKLANNSDKAQNYSPQSCTGDMNVAIWCYIENRSMFSKLPKSIA